MLKPKPVVLIEEQRPDFWVVLRRRKRTIKDFLETNEIKNIQMFKNWISGNEKEYLISDNFISEVSSHLTEQTSVTIEEVISPIIMLEKETQEEFNDYIKDVDKDISTTWEEEEIIQLLPETIEVTKENQNFSSEDNMEISHILTSKTKEKNSKKKTKN
jgi:hypothetical protein